MSLLEQFERYVRDVQAREGDVINGRLDFVRKTIVTSKKPYHVDETYNPWEETGMLAKWNKEQHLEEIKHAGDEYEV